MKRYKYITIKQNDNEQWNNKPLYRITNNNSGGVIGSIEYYPTWRKYIFAPNEVAVFDSVCLENITDFLKNHV